MNYQLTENIKHSQVYNPGGIIRLYLLDYEDYLSCRFLDDGMFTSGYIEEMDSTTTFVEVACTNATSFSEKVDDGLYTQSLQSFVNVLEAAKLSDLLRAASRRYIVAFRNLTGKMFCFATDGGATLSFEQATGQIGEGAGYRLTFAKKSTMPLFELDSATFNKTEIIDLLASEDEDIVTTENNRNTITIKKA